MRLVLLLLALLTATDAQADRVAGPLPEPVLLDPEAALADLDGHLETLADSAGVLTFEDVYRGAAAAAFRPSPSIVTREALLPEAVWARFRLRGPEDRPTVWRLETFLERVEIHVVDAGGRVERAVAGVDVSPGERAVDQGWPGAIEIVLAPGEERLVIARMLHDPDGSQMTSRARPFHVRPAATAATYNRRQMLVQGVFLGLLLTLAVYNLAFFVAFRDGSYLGYVGYTAGLAGYFATYHRVDLDLFGFADTSWGPVAHLLAMTVASASYPVFVRSFLRVVRTDRWLDRLLVACSVALASVPVLVWTVGWRSASVFQAVVFIVGGGISTLAIWRSWRAGFRPAGLLLLSTVALCSSAAWAMAPVLGAPHVFGVVGWLQVGVAAEALLLSVALAERVAHLRRDRAHVYHEKVQAEAAVGALQEANSLKTRLLGMAAHDLRNPLTGILGFAELLHDEAEPGSEARRFTAAIRTDAERMVALIDDLLITSALDRGQLVLHRTRLDVGGLVHEAAAPFQERARRKRQRLTVHCQEGLTVDADRARLRDAVANLVSNAVTYTPSGGSITIHAERVGHEVQIAVSDTGPGLSLDDQALLFQPFQQLSARPTGGEPSTGLGLSIVAEIVELHGGRVGAQGGSGEGSTFWISLPPASPSPLPAEIELEPVGVA